MGYRHINEKADALGVVVRDVLRLREDEANQLIDALTELARALADDEIDRVFNRGDYQ